MHYNLYIIFKNCEYNFYQSVLCYGALQRNRPWFFNLPSFSILFKKQRNESKCFNVSICTYMYKNLPPFYNIYRRSCFATCTRMFRLYRTINLLSKNKSNTLSWKIHQRKTFNRRFIRPYFVMLGYWVLIKNLWWLFLRQTTGSDPGSGQESKWLISHA